jgi:hypothetical protein
MENKTKEATIAPYPLRIYEEDEVLWNCAKHRTVDDNTTLRQLLLDGLALRLAKPLGWKPATKENEK